MRVIYLLIFFLIGQSICAQVYTNKEVGKKNQSLKDSLKITDYPYVLPIWGDKATKAGFSLPYSAGLGINYLWQESDIVIKNLQVGFNGGPLYDLDEIIKFNDAKATSNIINFRPDIWLLPFLNIYGIIATSETSTGIDISILAPDQFGSEEILSLKTAANFKATSLGFGITPTMGVGNGWIALDMNMSWTDIPELDKPAFSFVFGPRFGKTFKFKKPERNVALWVGGFRVHINSETSGTIALSDVIPTEGYGEKINEAQVKVADKQIQVDDWWNGLTPSEKLTNAARYEATTRILTRSSEFLDRLDAAADNAAESEVNYALDKQQKNLWNFIIGAQLQVNKHWMVRGEYGFLGSRQQFLCGLQYRFGL